MGRMENPKLTRLDKETNAIVRRVALLRNKIILMETSSAQAETDEKHEKFERLLEKDRAEVIELLRVYRFKLREMKLIYADDL